MNKWYLWLVNGCLERNWPIITNACPPKRSHNPLQPKLIPIPRRDSEMSNCETIHWNLGSVEVWWQRYLADFHFPDLVFIRISFGLFFQVLSLSRLCYLGASKTEQKYTYTIFLYYFVSKWWIPLNEARQTLFCNTTEVKNHVYVKRQTRDYTTWPSLPFACRLLFIISTHKLVVSRNFLSMRIVLSCFYQLIFYFEQFSTWVWRLPYTWSLNLNEGL